MVYGFKIIDDLTDGLGNYLDSKRFQLGERAGRQGGAECDRLAVPESSITSTRHGSTRTCASSAGAATSSARTRRTKPSRRP